MIGRRELLFAILGAPLVAPAALAAAPQNIRLAQNVVPAPFGYEALATQYVVAESTSLYVSPYIFPGTVNNEKLKPGETINALAKAKGYDWILVGKDGIGIGYIPVSRLTPAKR